MAYSYDQVFAADPANPANVAANASILIYAPGDATKAALTITDPSGSPLPNPITVNANGFGSAFMHETLDRVAWDGGGFSGFFTSYEGMKNEAVDARAAAETAAATAGADAAAVATAAIGTATDDAEAAAVSAASSASAASASATAAANAAALVGTPPDAAIAAAISGSGTETKTALDGAYAKKPTRVYDLRDSGAVGDGTTDDTAAIQSVITSLPDNSRLIGERGKTYLIGELLVTGKSDLVIDGNGATFKLKSTGARIAAFSVGGTASNLEFRNIRVKGTGVVTDAHGGIVGQSTAVLTNVTVADCVIEDVTLGISFSAEAVGSALTGVIYRNNRIKNIVGITSGNGYGLHISVANGNLVGAIIDGNVITSAQRHAIYCAKGIGFTVSNNVVLNHRSAISDGSILPAIMIARSTNVTIRGNAVLNPKGGALYLGGPSGLTAGAYTVTGNVFTNPQDAPALVYIGQDTPSVDGVPNGVIFANNMLTSLTAHTLMQVYNGLSVNITGNQFRMIGAGAATALTLTGSGTTGADYMDAVTVTQNYFDLDAANPASKVAVRFSPGHEAHTTKYWFRANRLIAGASMFTSSAVITNPNIAIADQETTGISFSAGVGSVPWRIDGVTTTTAPAAGGAGALPATPAGYAPININGTIRKVAYYT